MTDAPKTPEAPRPFPALLDSIAAAFNTGIVPTKEEAEALQAAIAKLTDPGRGGTLDFSDPANSGLLGIL